MLTKNLIKFRIRKGKIAPGFIDPSDEALLEGAQLLVSMFEESIGQTREALLEESNQLVEALPCETMIGRGFEKLLLDRTEFLVPSDEEQPRLRHQVFSLTSSALQQQEFVDFPAFATWAAQQFGQPINKLGEQLYADLPAQNPVIAFKSITAQSLLHRYNCSLIQWLLLHALSMILTLENAGPGSLRQLFKYLRFNQLLADIRMEGKHCQLTIEGPLSLFYQTRKYGMNLARFFPALLHQERWSLSAEIQVGTQRKGLLELDQHSGLKPAEERFLKYVPEEIKLFGEAVRKKCSGWKVLEATTFVNLQGEVHCFPDFSLKHESGTKVAIELFHNWHASALSTRLDQLDEHTDTPLLLGVAHGLANKTEQAQRLAASPYYQRWGFTYRDLPTITKLRPLLAQLGDPVNE